MYKIIGDLRHEKILVVNIWGFVYLVFASPSRYYDKLKNRLLRFKMNIFDLPNWKFVTDSTKVLPNSVQVFREGHKSLVLMPKPWRRILWPSQNIPTLVFKEKLVLLFDIQISANSAYKIIKFFCFFFVFLDNPLCHHRMLYKLHRKKGCNLAALAVGCFANCIINYCCVQLKDHLCLAALNLLCQKIMVRKMNFYPEFNCKLAEL